jgi:hypothetical protein
MAKLKAHGTELLRLEKERETPDGELTTWERKTRVVMADGKVLQKYDVQFKPDQFRPKGERYSYGWKLIAKAKPGKTAQDIVAVYLKVIAEKPDAGWKVVSGGPAPVIISEARILAAVESGDNIGFCKECGAEADGCEPDARNYRCESCGAMAVYGAEEMLVGV